MLKNNKKLISVFEKHSYDEMTVVNMWVIIN